MRPWLARGNGFLILETLPYGGEPVIDMPSDTVPDNSMSDRTCGFGVDGPILGRLPAGISEGL